MSLSRTSDGFCTLHTDLDSIFSFRLCRLVGKHSRVVQRFPCIPCKDSLDCCRLNSSCLARFYVTNLKEFSSKQEFQLYWSFEKTRPRQKRHEIISVATQDWEAVFEKTRPRTKWHEMISVVTQDWEAVFEKSSPKNKSLVMQDWKDGLCSWLLMTTTSSLTMFNEGLSRHKNAMSKLFLYETTAIIS